MHELIYVSDQAEYDQAQSAIRGQFPSAVFGDASDFIHEYRFEVSIEPCLRDTFYVFAIQEGLALACLGFQMMIRTDMDRAKRLLDQAKMSSQEAN